MEVILLEKVSNLGVLGDKVKVRSGYGRNFLIPFAKAVPATEANIKAFEVRRADLEAAAAAKLAAARARAAELQDKSFTLAAKAGDEGKLFGSVGVRDIADAISAAGIAVCKSEVRLPEGPLRAIGGYTVTLHLDTDVNVDVTVAIIAE